MTAENYVVHNNLGNALVAQGRLDEAIAHYAAAIQFRPDKARSWNNLGAALMLKGEDEKARHYFKRALEIQPGYPDALKNIERIQNSKGPNQ